MFDIKNIKRIYFVVLRRIRKFLLGDSGREFLIFLFFLVVSFGFWLLLTLNEVYHTELGIKVRLRNIPDEVVMTSEMPDEVKVRVEDRGTVLLNYMVGRTFYPLTFDFDEHVKGSSYIAVTPEEVRRKVQPQLNTTTRLVSVEPDTLSAIYTRGGKKRVPVVLNGKITPDRLYYISDISFTPDTIDVYAPSDILSRITAVYTKELTIARVADSVSHHVEFQPVTGAKFVPSSAELSVVADMYTEKSMEIPVVGVGFPSDKLLRTFPSKVKVVFQVSLKNYKKVSVSDFSIQVSYEDVVRNKAEKLFLKVTSCPSYVTHVRILPEQVDYLLEEKATLVMP